MEEKMDKKSDRRDDRKREEPKEEPMQMNSFITQDVHAPIYPVRPIPHTKIYKGYNKRK